jgi:hypothetical protein
MAFSDTLLAVSRPADKAALRAAGHPLLTSWRSLRRFAGSHMDADFVLDRPLFKLNDFFRVQPAAIHFDPGHPPVHPLAIVQRDIVDCLAPAKAQRYRLPSRGQDRINGQTLAPDLQAAHLLYQYTIHPTGGPGVPGPPSLAHPPRQGIDISGDDIGLHLVAGHIPWFSGVLYGIEQAQERGGPVTVPAPQQPQGQPERRVGVLSAVLAHSRRVALDIAGIRCRGVEGRG